LPGFSQGKMYCRWRSNDRDGYCLTGSDFGFGTGVTLMAVKSVPISSIRR